VEEADADHSQLGEGVDDWPGNDMKPAGQGREAQFTLVPMHGWFRR
jgi:hypothetical protein